MTSTLRIIVTGLIAQHPWPGAVTRDYLPFVLGLVRLGHAGDQNADRALGVVGYGAAMLVFTSIMNWLS
jgi:hypothetical protein